MRSVFDNAHGKRRKREKEIGISGCGKIPKEPFVKYCRGMFMIDKNELEELQSLYSLLMEMKSQGKNKEE